MNNDMLAQRVKDLAAAVDASVANHHGLLGRLNEAKEMLELLNKQAKESAEDVIEMSDVQE